MDRYPRPLHTQPGWPHHRLDHGAVDPERPLRVWVLPTSVGCGSGDCPGLDPPRTPLDCRRGSREGMVLRGNLDASTDTGHQLGSLEAWQVHGLGSTAAGESSSGNMPDLDGYLFRP